MPKGRHSFDHLQMREKHTCAASVQAVRQVRFHVVHRAEQVAFICRRPRQGSHATHAGRGECEHLFRLEPLRLPEGIFNHAFATKSIADLFNIDTESTERWLNYLFPHLHLSHRSGKSISVWPASQISPERSLRLLVPPLGSNSFLMAPATCRSPSGLTTCSTTFMLYCTARNYRCRYADFPQVRLPSNPTTGQACLPLFMSTSSNPAVGLSSLHLMEAEGTRANG